VNLPLQIDGIQDNSGELLAGGRVIFWADSLAGILDTRNLHEAEDGTAQIDEEAERVVAQHDTPYDNPAGEARLRRSPLLTGELAAIPVGTPLIRTKVHASDDAARSCRLRPSPTRSVPALHDVRQTPSGLTCILFCPYKGRASSQLSPVAGRSG